MRSWADRNSALGQRRTVRRPDSRPQYRIAAAIPAAPARGVGAGRMHDGRSGDTLKIGAGPMPRCARHNCAARCVGKAIGNRQ
ncbi:hypothetical protein SCOCK_240023 [Actinacidiphila cocklensis]|uniref:Uncharacterized protein n=1 Tax=Actinacidiphila cocklensis TaxID=887465 RepID=A0A9W4DMC3_9ACTN|nr:hypothetical protein SCOCK_240023 [Actinacidiphila cocklensis]